ncbi:Lrp/AsnC family transcriptional regulator [uncultured Neglectibacter sp.]|uniref:Lrp/AsnC family transcriptional regulator n=1 Tax=uncultured Neglectibacter sp. TaxID=1924108 RepID=UPI0034E00843
MAMNQVLGLLQEDATLTPAQLAVMLNETEADVKKAIADYEKEGVIKGYHALVNWERTDVHRATALIELRVSPQKDTGFDEIAGRVMNFPEVESVYLMSGGYDLAVTVTGATMSDIAMFVSKRLAPIDGVLSTATHFVLTKYKDGGIVYNSDYEERDERGSNLCD